MARETSPFPPLKRLDLNYAPLCEAVYLKVLALCEAVSFRARRPLGLNQDMIIPI